MQPADFARLLAQLERAAGVWRALFTDLPAEEARRRPADGGWSPLEILVHLLDEEREDFRPRLARTLATPEKAWDPIDPEGWVTERRYQERDPAETLQALLGERAASVRWLHELLSSWREDDTAVPWSNVYEHPVLGELTAGDLFAAWVAHDALHLRQLVKCWHQEVERSAPRNDSGYAGRW